MPRFETAGTVRAALCEAFTRLAEIFELAPDELEFRPDEPDAWTILEHLEHVSLANHFLLLTSAKGCRIALRRAQERSVPEGQSDLEPLAAVAIPGAFDWPPPLHMIPSRAKPSAEVRAELERQREQCLELLDRMPDGEGRLYQVRMSVNRLGRLDMYQWLYFLVQHARYHLSLIESRRKDRKRGGPSEATD